MEVVITNNNKTQTQQCVVFGFHDKYSHYLYNESSHKFINMTTGNDINIEIFKNKRKQNRKKILKQILDNSIIYKHILFSDNKSMSIFWKFDMDANGKMVIDPIIPSMFLHAKMKRRNPIKIDHSYRTQSVINCYTSFIFNVLPKQKIKLKFIQ